VFDPTANIEFDDGIFIGCKALLSVMLPRNIQFIPQGFFYGCSSLTEIRIPVSVQRILENSFDGCTSLQSIEFSENVNFIGPSTLMNCKSLESAVIRSSNINSEDNVFQNCLLLSTIKTYPWLWPKLFASMKQHPEFIFKFYKKYQTQNIQFGMSNIQHPKKRERINK